MTAGNNNIACSKIFPKVVAFWKMFMEYCGDYFSGNKWKDVRKNNNQK